MFSFSKDNIQSLWNVFQNVVANSNVVLANRMSYERTLPYIIKHDGNVHDYARWRTLQLVAQEINENAVPGSVAEAGVWTGWFSLLMNVQFPGRKQYLFDTFEGFCRNQIEQEHADGLISKWFTKEGLFADTGEQQVLNRLPNKEQVIICKGLFEEVAPTIAEDTFAFVSLDMDLYAPMLAGLEYFYPRLNPGGYMFLHDYNHSDILGVKKVILDFQAAHGVRLLKVPLPDEGGTVVLLK